MPNHSIEKCRRLIEKDKPAKVLAKKLARSIGRDNSLINAPFDKEGRSLFLFLALNDKTQVIEMLINETDQKLTESNRKMGIISFDNQGRSLLHYLVAMPEHQEMLIEMICNQFPELVNFQDKNGESPIFFAIKQDCPKAAIQLIRSNQVDLSLTNEANQTIFDLDACQGEVLRDLVIKGYQYRFESASTLTPAYTQKLAEDFPILSKIHSPRERKSHHSRRYSLIRSLSAFSSSTQSLDELSTPPSSARSYAGSSQSSSNRDVRASLLGSESSADSEKNLDAYTCHQHAIQEAGHDFLDLLLQEQFGQTRKRNIHLTRPRHFKKSDNLIRLLIQKQSGKNTIDLIELDYQLHGLQNELPLVKIIENCADLIGKLKPSQTLIVYYILWQSLCFNQQNINWQNEALLETLASFYQQNILAKRTNPLAREVNKKMIRLTRLLSLPIQDKQAQRLFTPTLTCFDELINQAIVTKTENRQSMVAEIASELTRMTLLFYHRVAIGEFYHKNWLQPTKHELAPTITWFTEYVNRMINYLTNKILSMSVWEVTSAIKLMIEITVNLLKPKPSQPLDFQSILILSVTLLQMDVERIMRHYQDAFSPKEMAIMKELESFYNTKGLKIQRLATEAYADRLPSIDQLQAPLIRIIESQDTGVEKCQSLGKIYDKVSSIKKLIESQIHDVNAKYAVGTYQFTTNLSQFIFAHELVADSQLNLKGRTLCPLAQDVVNLDSYHNGCRTALDHIYQEFIKHDRLPFLKYQDTTHPPESAATILIVWYRNHFNLARDEFISQQHASKKNLDKNKAQQTLTLRHMQGCIHRKFSEVLPLLEAVLQRLYEISQHYDFINLNRYYILTQCRAMKNDIQSFADYEKNLQHKHKFHKFFTPRKAIGKLRTFSHESIKLDKIHSLSSEPSSMEGSIYTQ